MQKKASSTRIKTPVRAQKVYILQNFGYTLGMKTNLIFVNGTMGAGKTAAEAIDEYIRAKKA